MFLSRLYIEKYKSIELIDLKFEKGKNVIVGRNNSGKSNILKAIDLVLGEYSPTYNKSENITDNDFFCGNAEEPIFIWCEISRDVDTELGTLEPIDFTEVEKSAFFRVYNDKPLSSEIRISITDFNAIEKSKIFEFCSEEGQAKIDNNELFKKWIGGKQYCKSNFNTEFANKSRFAIAFTSVKNEFGKFEKELVLLYKEDDSNNWIQGINCNLRNILIQSAIIPAFRDPKDQLRINSFTWFGKLLKAYVKTDSNELNDAFGAVKLASDGLFKGLKDKITEREIEIAFPNTSISFQFNPDSKQDIHKSTLIYVNDGFNSELKDKGAGIQSAVTISLFDFYVRNIAHNASSLLAVEEPELYLHPHGRRVISDRLNRFVDKGKNQVIITTHSPEFIATANEIQNIISVRKNDVATTAKNIYFNSPKRKQILIKKQNAEMFFADAVILCEGAEKYFIEEASRLYGKSTNCVSEDGEIINLGESWVNDYNISIINCGGKHELWKYVEILTELGIPFLVTADFDFLRDGLNQFFTNLNYPQEKSDLLNAIKSKINLKIPNGKYKSIVQLSEKELILETKLFLSNIESLNIFIFSGELENFYTNPPIFDKEAGVIETMGKILENTNELSDYLNCAEYFMALEFFAKNIIGLEIVKEVAISN